MDFTIVDSHAIYQRLLDAPDSAARAEIFAQELVTPFNGLTQLYGGDSISVFAQWNMSVDQFDEAHHDEKRRWLAMLAQANAWERSAAALERGKAAFAPFAERIKLDTVIFGLYLADLSNAPWSRGYSGFGAMPGWIMTVYGEPTPYNLERVEALTAHELHHNILNASDMALNWHTTTVEQYMVMEGLAESFAVELYGEQQAGPWVTEFSDRDLEKTKAIFRDGLKRSGFNVTRTYIFGGEIADQDGVEKASVPMMAGYAIGYQVVQQYLKRIGKRVAEATFVPAEQIVAESGFFA